MKKLEAGDKAFERPSGRRHRKVRLADVIEYQGAHRIEKRAAPYALSEEAANLGLYGVVPAHDAGKYSAILGSEAAKIGSLVQLFGL